MSGVNSLTEKLRPHTDSLIKASLNGDEKAREIINLYQMYVACPNDPGAPALCEAAFDEWIKKEE